MNQSPLFAGRALATPCLGENGDFVPFPKTAGFGGLEDFSHILMPRYQGIGGKGISASQQVNIRAADPGCADLDQHILLPGHRIRQLLEEKVIRTS
jgi:hypothetical protein